MRRVSRNWGIFGTSNTGKTHSALEIAASLQKIQPQILIFNHDGNPSYDQFKRKIKVENLKGSLRADFVGQIVGQRKDFDLFLNWASANVRHATIIIDDCGVIVQNLSATAENFMNTTKNNNYDVIWQMHQFRQPPPKFLANLKYWVVKQTSDTEIKKTVPNAELIQLLRKEIWLENQQRPEGQKWATRFLNDEREELNWIDLEGQLHTKKYDELIDYRF